MGRNSAVKEGAIYEMCDVMRREDVTENVTLLEKPGSVLSVKYFELKSVH